MRMTTKDMKRDAYKEKTQVERMYSLSLSPIISVCLSFVFSLSSQIQKAALTRAENKLTLTTTDEAMKGLKKCNSSLLQHKHSISKNTLKAIRARNFRSENCKLKLLFVFYKVNLFEGKAELLKGPNARRGETRLEAARAWTTATKLETGPTGREMERQPCLP